MTDDNRVEYWAYTKHAHLTAMKSNDSRAKLEDVEIQSGAGLAEVHAETLKTFPEIKKLVLGGIRFLKLMKIPFSGSVIDLGSGVGTVATIVSRVPEVEKVYAVEYSEQFVLKSMPAVFKHFKADEAKIVRVVGDFNMFQLPDASVSLIVEVDSLHHAEDLDLTLRECSRVLKPGGVLLAVDRAWPDSLSPADLDAKLNVEYSTARKALWGIPAEKVFRRRDFGEHEYRIKDWLAFFIRNGFDAHVFSQAHPRFFNTLIFNRLPTFAFTILMSSLMARLGVRRYSIYGFNLTRKLFVCVKR
jgi:SAM-dependent methyltransferase